MPDLAMLLLMMLAFLFGRAFSFVPHYKQGKGNTLSRESAPSLLQPAYTSHVPFDFALSALNMQKSIEIIREKVLISQIISHFGYALKPTGQNSYTCLCPFHEDSNPSMSVSDDKGMYHCFSCGAGGDTIKFVREIESLSYSEAVVKVLTLAGVATDNNLTLSDDKAFSKQEIEMFRKRARIEEALAKAAAFYSMRMLQDVRAGAARGHLMSRKIKPQTAFRFQIGYSPSSTYASTGGGTLTANLTAQGFTIDELVAAGLTMVGERNDTTSGSSSSSRRSSSDMAGSVYDRFRDRLMIPIRNAQGLVIGFGGRILESGPSKQAKYINSPETQVFKKSNTLFGLDLARKAMTSEGQAVIVEGYFDVIAMHDVGIECVVAAMGTSLTREQLEAASRAGKGKVILLFDGDEAGQAATQRIIEQLLPSMNAASKKNAIGNARGQTPAIDLRVASLPSGPVVVRNGDASKKKGKSDDPPKDASDVCVRLGPVAAQEALRDALTRSVGWKQWMCDRIISSLIGQLREGEHVPIDEEEFASAHDPTASIITTAGLDSSSPKADAAKMILTPDMLTKAAANLSRFIGSLPDASDRTILCYYAAEKLSGGRASFRMQLENDLLSAAKRFHDLRDADARAEAERLHNSEAVRNVKGKALTAQKNKEERIYTLEATLEKTKKNLEEERQLRMQITALAKASNQDAAKKLLPPSPSVANMHQNLQHQQIQQKQQQHQHMQQRRLTANEAQGMQTSANAEADAALVGLELDAAVLQNEASPARRKFNVKANKLWESHAFLAQTGEEVLPFDRSESSLPSRKSQTSFLSLCETRGRTEGAEQTLLAVFLKRPALRGAVKVATARLYGMAEQNSNVASSLEERSVWVGEGHKELWEEMLLADEHEAYTAMREAQGPGEEDPLLSVLVDLSPKAHEALKGVLESTSAKQGEIRSDLDAEYCIAAATQLLSVYKARDRQISLIRRTNFAEQEPCLEEQGEEANTLSLDIARQQDRLLSLFEQEKQKRKTSSQAAFFESSKSFYSSPGGDEVSKGGDAPELPSASFSKALKLHSEHDALDEDDDVRRFEMRYALQQQQEEEEEGGGEEDEQHGQQSRGTKEVNTAKDRYAFSFSSLDTDRVLVEGEIPLEEQDLLQGAAQQGSSYKPRGYSLGLEDVYDVNWTNTNKPSKQQQEKKKKPNEVEEEDEVEKNPRWRKKNPQIMDLL